MKNTFNKAKKELASKGLVKFLIHLPNEFYFHEVYCLEGLNKLFDRFKNVSYPCEFIILK